MGQNPSKITQSLRKKVGDRIKPTRGRLSLLFGPGGKKVVKGTLQKAQTSTNVLLNVTPLKELKSQSWIAGAVVLVAEPPPPDHHDRGSTSSI